MKNIDYNKYRESLNDAFNKKDFEKIAALHHWLRTRSIILNIILVSYLLIIIKLLCIGYMLMVYKEMDVLTPIILVAITIIIQVWDPTPEMPK